MRKIEQEMLAALYGLRNFTKGNTIVSFSNCKRRGNVYLHGNHLGYYDPLELVFVTNKLTLAAYPTPTTTSRLRALGVNVVVKKGLPYIDGKLVT